MTDTGEHGSMLAGLPGDIAEFCRLVQGVMVHTFWAHRYGLALSEEQKLVAEVQTCYNQSVPTEWR